MKIQITEKTEIGAFIQKTSFTVDSVKKYSGFDLNDSKAFTCLVDVSSMRADAREKDYTEFLKLDSRVSSGKFYANEGVVDYAIQKSLLDAIGVDYKIKNGKFKITTDDPNETVTINLSRSIETDSSKVGGLVVSITVRSMYNSCDELTSFYKAKVSNYLEAKLPEIELIANEHMNNPVILRPEDLHPDDSENPFNKVVGFFRKVFV